MNEVAVFIIILILLIVSQVYFYYNNKKQENKESIYRVVKAGDVAQATELYVAMKSLNNRTFTHNGQYVNINDYKVFIVKGESMSNDNIHTGDVVFVKELIGESRLSITNGKILLLEIQNSKNEQGDAEYKLRRFIDYISMNKVNVNEWINEHQIQQDTKFINKFESAKKRLSESTNENDLFLCSMTWHEGELDYSFHPIKVLVGIVEFSLPKEKI